MVEENQACRVGVKRGGVGKTKTAAGRSKVCSSSSSSRQHGWIDVLHANARVLHVDGQKGGAQHLLKAGDIVWVVL